MLGGAEGIPVKIANAFEPFLKIPLLVAVTTNETQLLSSSRTSSTAADFNVSYEISKARFSVAPVPAPTLPINAFRFWIVGDLSAPETVTITFATIGLERFPLSTTLTVNASKVPAEFAGGIQKTLLFLITVLLLASKRAAAAAAAAVVCAPLGLEPIFRL